MFMHMLYGHNITENYNILFVVLRCMMFQDMVLQL